MTILALAAGACLLFFGCLVVLLVVTYKSGHASGREQERARWLPRVRELTAQLDDMRLRVPPPSPWLHAPPGRPLGGPRRAVPRPGDFAPGRPQRAPYPSSTPDTGIHEAVRTTGGMRALTDELCNQIEAGTWPPS